MNYALEAYQELREVLGAVDLDAVAEINNTLEARPSEPYDVSGHAKKHAESFLAAHALCRSVLAEYQNKIDRDTYKLISYVSFDVGDLLEKLNFWEYGNSPSIMQMLDAPGLQRVQRALTRLAVFRDVDVTVWDTVLTMIVRNADGTYTAAQMVDAINTALVN